jgi:hypothetical protein
LNIIHNIFIFISGFFLALKSKAAGSIYDLISTKFSFGLWLYQTYCIVNNILFTRAITKSNNQYLSERMLFDIHQLHRSLGLNSRMKDVIGLPCSINFSFTIPADLLLEKYLKVTSKVVDNRYFLSQEVNEKNEYIEEILKDEYLGVLFDNEVNGSIAYLSMICFASATGIVFTEYTYRSCIKIIQKALLQQNFDESKFSDKQKIRMIYCCSCLLPNTKLRDEYCLKLDNFFTDMKTDNPVTVTTICFDLLINKIGEY